MQHKPYSSRLVSAVQLSRSQLRAGTAFYHFCLQRDGISAPSPCSARGSEIPLPLQPFPPAAAPFASLLFTQPRLPYSTALALPSRPTRSASVQVSAWLGWGHCLARLPSTGWPVPHVGTIDTLGWTALVSPLVSPSVRQASQASQASQPSLSVGSMCQSCPVSPPSPPTAPASGPSARPPVPQLLTAHGMGFLHNPIPTDMVICSRLKAVFQSLPCCMSTNSPLADLPVLLFVCVLLMPTTHCGNFPSLVFLVLGLYCPSAYRCRYFSIITNPAAKSLLLQYHRQPVA